MTTKITLRIKLAGTDDAAAPSAVPSALHQAMRVMPAAGAEPLDDDEPVAPFKMPQRRVAPKTGGTRAAVGLATGVVVGAGVLGALLFTGRAGRQARATPVAAPAAPMPLAAVEAAPAPLAAVAPQAQVPAVTTEARPEAPASVGVADETAAIACKTAYDDKDWPATIAACPAAFEAHPDRAWLALRAAKAMYARSRPADAMAWAKRAAAVDGSLAEAYFLIAEGERRAGDEEAADKAYRRYLRLAPRGWHAGMVRAALARE